MTKKPRLFTSRGRASQPRDIELWPILTLHRVGDSFVRLAHEVDEVDPETGEKARRLRDITHLRVDDLPRLFPQFRDELLEDSFYSINAFHRKGTGKAGDIRAFNACFTDLDYYKRGVERGQAIGVLIMAQDRGIIPPPSMICDSGRGLWLFYLLVDDDGGPLRYHPRDAHMMRTFRKVQEALYATIHADIPELNPDPQAKDPARLTRVPGSITNKPMVPTRVTYWVQLDHRGQAYTYTLDTLSDLLNADELVADPWTREPFTVADKRPKRVRHVPARLRGFQAMHMGRLADFERLWEMRGGFDEGCRNFAALFYAVTLRALKYSPLEIEHRLDELRHKCRPPLTRQEIRDAIKSSETLYRLKDKTIIERLEITGDELADLEYIRPDREPRRAGRPPSERRPARQEILTEILRENPPFSTRVLARLLKPHGFNVTHRTVARDLHDIYERHPELNPKQPLPFKDHEHDET